MWLRRLCRASVCIALILVMTTAVADDRMISRIIAKEMAAAQSALKSGNWQDALANLAAAQAKSPLSPFDRKTILEFEAFAHIKLGDLKAAQQESEDELATCGANAADTDTTMHVLFQLAVSNADYVKAAAYGIYARKSGTATARDLATLSQVFFKLNDCPDAVDYANQAAAQENGQADTPPFKTAALIKLQCTAHPGSRPALPVATLPFSQCSANTLTANQTPARQSPAGDQLAASNAARAPLPASPTANVDANERRVALVIGNSAYQSGPLKNPANDASDMAAKLKSLGFEVISRYNLTTRQIGGTLREFRSKLAPGGVALFFYAGHGVQISGENYLPATDAEISTEDDVPNQSLALQQIMSVLDESKVRLSLIFLDACRDNPFARSFRGAAGGLAKVDAPSGTLISFATRPGSVASDGAGRNGLYTQNLLLAMDIPDQPIELALKRVVSAVKKDSNGKQEPWMEGSIEGDFYFRHGK